jgi:hypothetical protein
MNSYIKRPPIKDKRQELIDTVLANLQIKYQNSNINWSNNQENFYKDKIAVLEDDLVSAIPSDFVDTNLISNTFGTKIHDKYLNITPIIPSSNTNYLNSTYDPDRMRHKTTISGGKIKGRKIKSRKIKSKKIKSKKIKSRKIKLKKNE